MNNRLMQILQGTGIAVLFLAGYVLFNTLAITIFPQYIYYFTIVHVLLIPYLSLFYTLTTYYRSQDEALTKQTLIYSLVGSSLLVGTYFLFPEVSFYIQKAAVLVLPFIAVYNYFRFSR